MIWYAGTVMDDNRDQASADELARRIQEAEAELWRRYLRRPSRALRNALAIHYQPFLRKVARHLAYRMPVPAEDLVSDGQVALLRAIEEFDPCRGARFRTFATSRLRWAMFDEIRRRDVLARGWRQRPGAPAIFSLDSRLAGAGGDGQDGTLKDLLAVRGGGDAMKRMEEADGLEPYLLDCNLSERAVLILRFEYDLLLREIGCVLGVSMARVAQILEAVLARLRRQLAGQGLLTAVGKGATS